MGKQFLQQSLYKKLQKGKKITIPYVMAGDGGLDRLEDQLVFFKECGAAAVELGIPFSDPVADGPVIQQAGARAIQAGTTLARVLEKLAACPHPHPIPIILMTYLNPLLATGLQNFFEACGAAGVDGLIIPDLPLEEEGIISEQADQASIALIRLAALTSPPERLAELARRSDTFIYAVSVTGTTGGRKQHDLQELAPYLQELKAISNTPVLAGFGISNPVQARKLANCCDGVIIGSRIIELLAQNKRNTVKELIGAV